ncbi:hypothetical protein GNT65_17450 [Shewanella sp. JBTF-M18]|uniref:Uncharacterized protein n=1 Tax=Shewanella insulae TaxID=2681496 RepID=A0A6L7I1L4_9GAMM|nr:hypothetical protein [Shewanella insulae]MXR70447.1 hypothetical protein [Shewanella insulae]
MYQAASPRQPTLLFIAIAALIYLPLIESLLPGLFAAYWVDPSFMAKVKPMALMIKLIVVFFGFWKLEQFRRQFSDFIRGHWLVSFLIKLSFLVGIIQLVLLSLGLFMNLVFGAPANEQSQFKRYEDYAIWVQTVDPGAMGKAYHRVWMQCDLPLWRYRLAPIQTLDWMGEYEVSLDEHILKISSRFDEIRLDLSKVPGCPSA